MSHQTKELMMHGIVTSTTNSTGDCSNNNSAMETTSLLALMTNDEAAQPIAATISTDELDFKDEQDASPSPVANNALQGVCNNVSNARARIRDIEIRMASYHLANQGLSTAQEQQLKVLRKMHYTEQICLVDALVVMGWEHYRNVLEQSDSHVAAQMTVRNTYEEALDISIKVFCSSQDNVESAAQALNTDRLMVLLLVLDFDEYCEALFQYRLTEDYLQASPLTGNESLRRIEELLNTPTRGDDYLQRIYELWKNGEFDRLGPIATINEEEDNMAKVHAAGLCLALFHNLESSRVDDHAMMERQYQNLFENYLPKQLAQRPSMNNIVSTKYSRVLFHIDGRPTVYWSLVANTYRKEWEENCGNDHMGDGDDDESTYMDTDDEDDGL